MGPYRDDSEDDDGKESLFWRMMGEGKNGLPVSLWYAADVVLSDNNAVSRTETTKHMERRHFKKTVRRVTRRIDCSCDEDLQNTNGNCIMDGTWIIDSVNSVTLVKHMRDTPGIKS